VASEITKGGTSIRPRMDAWSVTCRKSAIRCASVPESCCGSARAAGSRLRMTGKLG
jgi:hypothetical protein